MINRKLSLTCNNKNYDSLYYNGKSQSVRAWAKEYNISYYTLRNKVKKGFSIQEILEKKPEELQKTYNEVFVERLKDVSCIENFFTNLQKRRTVKDLEIKQLTHPKFKGLYQLWITFYSYGLLREEAKELCRNNKDVDLTWSIQDLRKRELELVEQDSRVGELRCLASSIQKN